MEGFLDKITTKATKLSSSLNQKLKQWQQQYITYHWPDFDQTLKLGFCDQQQ